MGQDEDCRDPPIQHCPDGGVSPVSSRTGASKFDTVTPTSLIPFSPFGLTHPATLAPRTVLNMRAPRTVLVAFHDCTQQTGVRSDIRTELLLLQRNPRNFGRVLVSYRAVLHGRAFRPKPKLKWHYRHLDLGLLDENAGFFGVLNKGPN